MVMMDQSRRLAEPLRWGAREKSAIVALVACVVIAAGGLWASGVTSGEPSAPDCVNVTFASTLGAAKVHACGARARSICAAPEAFSSSIDELTKSCRKAGYPVGRKA